MKKYPIILIVLTLILLPALSMLGQKTVLYDPPTVTYDNALQLFERENYGAAGPLFDKVRQQIDDPANAFSENAAYYGTLCSVFLGERNALRKVEDFVDTYPASIWIPAVHFELGKLYYSKRKYREAISSFREVRPGQLNKAERAEYYFKKGFCEMQLGNENAALSSFNRATNYNSSYNSPSRYYIAHINYNEGKYSEALKDFKAIEDDRRFSKYVPNYLIHIYYEMGDFQRVIKEGSDYYDKADSKAKGDVAGLIANAYYNLEDYSMALEYFDIYERMVRKEIEPSESYRIGYTRFLEGQYGAAIYNFQDASKGDEAFAQNAWYHLGFCYLNTGESKFAQQAFLKAYKVKSNNREIATDALYNYIKVTLELGSDPYNDPVTTVTEFINANPDLPRIDEAYELLAQLYLTSRKYKAALESIEQNRNPNRKLQATYQQIAYTQAMEYFNRGEYKEAINYLDKSLYYTPDRDLQARSIYWYADALYKQNNYREAAEKYKQFMGLSGIQSNPLYGPAGYNLAYTYFNRKQYPAAIDQFSRFLSLSEQDPDLQSDARLRLADSYYITKNYSNALRWYDQVVARNGGNAAYAMYQQAFCYGAQGNFNKKIATLKSLVSKYPEALQYDDALYEIASTSLILKDQRSAIVYFDKLVKEKPGSSYAKKSLVKMGFVYYSGKQYDQAIRALKQVIDRYPASMEAREALNTLQNVYMDMGQVDKYFAYARSLDFVQVSTSDEDSLTFIAGENYYIMNDCNNAINLLENYLKQFPEGGFVLKSYYYLSLCYEKQGASDQAIAYYEKIIAFPQNEYTNISLLKAARMEFEKKDYQKAYGYYEQLSRIAEDPGMMLEARDGAMRGAYLLNQYDLAGKYAGELIESANASDEQLVLAWYILGKSSLERNNTDDAERCFRQVDERTSGEMGAEAKFLLASINYQKNALDAAENLIYELPDQYPDYDYWIARGFILLADIYVARDNTFQAEQTLKSVIENYPGEDLKEEARIKLEQLTPEQPTETNNDDEIEIE